MKWSPVLRSLVAAGLFSASVWALACLPLSQELGRCLDWLPSVGPAGRVLILVVSYLALCLLLLPSTGLNLAAGYLFGAAWGAAVASLGSTLAATAAFLLGRFLFRDWLERRLASQPRYQVLDRALGSQGLKIVVLVRLCSPVPFGMASYAFGLMRVSTGRFMLGSWLGRLPQIVVCAYAGSTAQSLADLAAGKLEVGSVEPILLGLGLLALAAVTGLITRIARRALREAAGE